MLDIVDPRATAIHLEVWLDGGSPIGHTYVDQGSGRLDLARRDERRASHRRTARVRQQPA
jgi:hypothetical protein